MKIELKNITYNERMSEETLCFVADLYINGKKVGECKNDGRGGGNDYRGYTHEDNKIIAEAEAYCKTLPKVKSETYNFEYQPTLESVIDDKLEEWLKKREEKKMQKLMESAILIGKPNSATYSYFKQKRRLSEFPINVLQPFIDNLKAKYCTDGNVILNTNLAELGLKG